MIDLTNAPKMAAGMVTARLMLPWYLYVVPAFFFLFVCMEGIDSHPAGPGETVWIVSLVLTALSVCAMLGIAASPTIIRDEALDSEFHHLRDSQRAYRSDETRAAEIEAAAKMRELGLQAQPYPLYFWEADPADPEIEGDITVRVKCLTPTQRFHSFIQGYRLTDASGLRVTVAEDGEEDEPRLVTLTVTPQTLHPHREDPAMAGILTLEDEATLTRVQSWVTQLNTEARSQYRRALHGQPAALPSGESLMLPEPTPSELRLEQVTRIQRHLIPR